MGSIISRLRGGSSQPSNKTIAKLASLQTDIQTLEKKRNQVKTSQQLLLRRMFYFTCSFTLMYAILAYTLLPSLLIAWINANEQWLDFLILWLPVAIIPGLYVGLKKSVVKWYNWRINRWSRKLSTKRKAKTEILDNVMETETYNNAMKIFEQFDRSRLNAAPKLPQNQKMNEAKVRQRTVAQASTANVHPFVRNSSVKYSGFTRNTLDKDNIRNMAHNYTFSGKSSTTTPSNNRLNYTINNSTPTYESPQTKSTFESHSNSHSETEKTPKPTKKAQKIKLGPAAPSLDEDALKALTKGLVGKKKRSVKRVKEDKSSHEEKSVEAPLPPQKNSEQVTSPRSRELREAKSKIQELQDEIARLKAIEDEKNAGITVVGKIPNKALTKSSTNSSRAEMILRAKKIEKQSNVKSKLIVEQQLLKKSATQESTLSGLIAELPDSESEIAEISQRPSQSSLMTDQSENEENHQNSTVVADDNKITDDEQEEVVSISDEGRGNSNEDNSLENIENAGQKTKLRDEVSEDELLDSEDDENLPPPQSVSPEINEIVTP